MDYDELVQRMNITRSYLANHPTHGSWEEAGVVEQAADAITKLRAERDNAIAECVMHIGNAKALRDRLNWFEEAGGVAMATRIYQVIGERDALAALLRECREDWIRLAYGASHEDVAAYRDFATRIDAALAKYKP